MADTAYILIARSFVVGFAKFANGSEAQGVREFAARHVVDPAQAALLRDKTVSLRYLDYDWALNQ